MIALVMEVTSAAAGQVLIKLSVNETAIKLRYLQLNKHLETTLIHLPARDHRCPMSP